MSEIEKFDLVVIGAGPAGYTGAIRAAQLGMKVGSIDKNNSLGGTCLNVGCIPSKALLNMSHKFHELEYEYKDIGIECSNITFNFEIMMNKKKQIISDLCKGIDGLFVKNKITKFTGSAQIIDSNHILIDNGKKIFAKNILIATGSTVMPIAGANIDEKNIISSTGALELTAVPKDLVVIGGGYIGLELGSVYKRLGARVRVVEYMKEIVPALDKDLKLALHKTLEKQGIEFILNHKMLEAKSSNNKVTITIENNESSEKTTITTDKVLISIGRKPNTENLGLESLGIKRDARGYITVDQNYRTAISNIYAVGDVIPGPMLAHKAEEEAVAAVEIIHNGIGHVNYHLIPSVVYTSPEVASVGLTEEQAKANNIDYTIGKFPFMANSRARSNLNTEGFIKLVVEKTSDRIIGAHIIGQEAGTMIAQLTTAMEFYASSEDIARTCHAHPTLSEAIKEAALSVSKRCINI